MVSTEWRDQTHVHSYMDAWNSGRIYSFSLPLSPYSATEFFLIESLFSITQLKLQAAAL